MQNILSKELYDEIALSSIKRSTYFSVVPNTDFNFEEDYPVFLYNNKAVIIIIYVDDNVAVVSDYNGGEHIVRKIRDLKFLCWLKNKDKYIEYFI